MKIKRKHFAPGTLVAPVPPAMVTVGDYDNANIITIAWTGILNSQPPKTYVSIRPSRHSYGILKEKGEFVINLPSASLARETDYVGIYTGAKVDKWAKTGLSKAKSEKVAPPTIAECPIAIECRVSEVIPMGSHDVFMADIVGISCREDIVDENGKMHFDRADLLAYAHGEYYELGEVVGRFGFSTDKLKKAEEKPKKAVEPEKKPFYENAPRGKSAKKKPTDKNKGAPHGRRVKK
jgi:flavin reductase (DIM6/NTAB) family NADH-FMN oxidoreductase RutF